MKYLKLLIVAALVSVTSLASIAPGSSDEKKVIVKCGHYDLSQYVYVSAFKGIIHKEHRYELVNNTTQESMYVDFEANSEGAHIKATEIYEHNPQTGAAVKYRKLAIISWNYLFYMDVIESTGEKSKIGCAVVR